MNRVSAASPEPSIVGGRALSLLDRAFLLLERTGAALGDRDNPWLDTGAHAMLALLVSCVSGVVLLFWYDTSVHSAHASLENLGLAGQITRSLHRTSSDAALFLAALHGLRLFARARFGGARVLAWVTGVILVGGIWLVGWLGYWLVWDQRAHAVAVVTARWLDVLPVFADPLSRSFLTDGSVNTLLFFVVFFLHMLIPLALGIPLWLHLARLARARWWPGRGAALVATGVMLALSLWVPATSEAPARMLEAPAGLTLDAWYLFPLYLTGGAPPAALWALVILPGAALLAVPWVLVRSRAAPAALDASRCNGCTLCSRDCPYAAIRMVPRTDGRGYDAQAEVDPARCVGCGICAGSCDPGGIGLLQLPVQAVRRRVEGWLVQEPGARIAFLCATSAGADFGVDAESGRCPELPGHRVVSLPCAGWVQPLTVERVLRRGAAEVLIVTCGGSCTYREGALLTELRMAGAREPALRRERLPVERLRVLHLPAGRWRELTRLAAGPREVRWVPRAVAATGTAALLGAITVLPTFAAWAGPPPRTELVVSFKHPGRSSEVCRDLGPEELARQPVHMRRDRVCERGRAPVRLRVTVDGATALDRAYEGSGLRADGNAIAVERIPLAPGAHRVAVAIGDGVDPAVFEHATSGPIDLAPGGRAVVLFDRLAGFTWAGAPGDDG